jgi:hypothetical protein
MNRCSSLQPGFVIGPRPRCPLSDGHDGPCGSDRLGWWPGPAPAPRADSRPLIELSSSGVLWLVNRVVFHPRGFALALDVTRPETGEVLGWAIQGDGSGPWSFTDDRDDVNFARVEALLAEHRRPA